MDILPQVYNTINYPGYETKESVQSQQTGSHREFQELALQGAYSSKTHIFRLPTEIISEIFKLTQIKKVQYINRVRVSWSWITITHVCRLWRKIAIDTQALWCYINIDLISTEQTKAYLERSNTSKLTVYHGAGTEKDALERLSLVVKHIHRIRKLHIIGLVKFSEDIQSDLQNPALVLEDLTIDTYSNRPFDIHTLLGGHAPKLTTLSLRANSPLCTSAPIMQNLRSLCIGSISSPFTLQDTYKILERNPNIENFCIFCQPSIISPDDLRPPQSLLQLPFLTDFVIKRGLYESISELLKNIVSPNLLRWNFNCHTYPLRNYPNTDPKALIPRNSNGRRDCSCLFISICPDYVVIDDRGCSELCEDENSLPRTLKCSWDFDSEDDETIKAVSEGFGVVSAAVKDGFWFPTQILIISIEANSTPFWNSGYSHVTWRRLLRNLPMLETLCVSHVRHIRLQDTILRVSPAMLLKALTFSWVGENHEKCYICPKLRSLHLCGFNARRDLPDLIHYLSRRASSGYKLWTLELCEPFGLTDEILISLRKTEIAVDIKTIRDIHFLHDSEKAETMSEDEEEEEDYTNDD